MTTSATRSASSKLPAFERSAEIYDLMYSGKDYDREAAVYMHHFGDAKSVLEMGAGTGEFTRRFVAAGLDVVASEPSREMQAQFARKMGYVPVGCYWQSLGLTGRKFGAFAAPFTVLSYAVADGPYLETCLRNAFEALEPGGRLVMDVLNYACCCASLKKYDARMAGGWKRWMRREFDPHDGILTVSASFSRVNESGTEIDAFRETHLMRAFTPAELEYACRQVGFRSVRCFPYDDESEIVGVQLGDFYFMVVAEK